MRSLFAEVQVSRSTAYIKPHTKRVTDLLEAVCKYLDIDNQFSVNFLTELPTHSGFGSGTRHDLSVAKGVSLLSKKRVTAGQLAYTLGRGKRSMMGIKLFGKGGFAVETGGITSQCSMPSDWRVVLIDPKIEASDKTFIHGLAEHSSIASCTACSPKTGRRLINAVSKDMVNSVHENNFKQFELVVKSFARSCSHAVRTISRWNRVY